jgi:hypothetical protein
LGIRDREFDGKARDEYRILMLGDSFTFGTTVEQQDTIGGYLQAGLDTESLPRSVTVINFGVPASGPWQQQGMLREKGFDLEPDLILHQLFLGNDLRDTLARTGDFLRAYNEDWQLELVRLRKLSMRRFMAEQWLADHSRAYAALRSSIGRGKITEFLADDLRPLPPADRSRLPQNILRAPSWEVNLVEWYPELERAFDELIETVKELRDECESRGVDYVLYAVPQIDEIVDEWFEERVSYYDEPTVYDMSKSNRVLTTELEAAQIPFISLYERMRRYDDPANLFLEFDGHTTPEGNRVIAEALQEYLVGTYFPAHPIDPPETN